MSHITANGGKWRAQIYRCGIRKSRTFLSEAEAQGWAEAEEARVLRRHQRQLAANESALASTMPRRVIDAIKSTDYGKDEIVEHAIPYATSCGIYFLIHKGEVVYVGQSIDILGRIAKHRREGKQFDAFNYIECLSEHLTTTEANYILALMPILNLALGRVPAEI